MPGDVKVGQTINITVNTTGYNLTVWINGVKQDIVDGNITYNVDAIGIYNITAKTTENDTYYAGSKTVVFEAFKNNATLIISNIGIVRVGDVIIITVANTTDGEITIKLDGVAVTNGTTFTPTLEGKYTITVELLMQLLSAMM